MFYIGIKQALKEQERIRSKLPKQTFIQTDEQSDEQTDEHREDEHGEDEQEEKSVFSFNR
jgi:hypothetical protein